MASSLENLEHRLAHEAAAFGKREARGGANSGQLTWKICGLTGLPPTAAALRRKAIGKLRGMLAAQRRWARASHPAYDLNRHLAIREALAALENMKDGGP
ncbi:hypothetical protein [Salaquimonas pukyongi]|uniref:hypothetical protein n=1 Tax=Salaquimonas pukyongi TaxID=2712698 RepID=UPI00096B903C|nr:hypothetical protein [Salaquimonas pukyongi]